MPGKRKPACAAMTSVSGRGRSRRGGAAGHDPATGGDDDDAIDQRQRLVNAVFHQDERRSQTIHDPRQHRPHLGGSVWVEIRGRLVEHQETWAQCQRPGQGQTLLLAPRQRVGWTLAPVREVDGGQGRIHTRPDAVGRDASVLEPEGDVVTGAPHHDLGFGILEQDPRPITRRARIEPVHQQRSLGLAPTGRIQETGNSSQQRRLSRAGRTQ
jgi:hypothetical protein